MVQCRRTDREPCPVDQWRNTFAAVARREIVRQLPGDAKDGNGDGGGLNGVDGGVETWGVAVEKEEETDSIHGDCRKRYRIKGEEEV